ncbi:hypothetical protein EV127DRAFT_408554 [Xylaria flabelliformis]|nr:hypothetical protein EV127DRAFT_408554 [Xylaria flabelliformis]
MEPSEIPEMPEQYYTLDGRIASFYPAKPAARRGSNTKGKAPKALSWPHKRLDPETFARAGFYFAPTPETPDNTNMMGWEEDDNPFVEHIRLSPHCGWAVVAGIETGLGDYALDDPTSSEMIAARKATFGDRWPHDGKRGWKCKTKQLVDAGWKYTPTMESDDMATCTYCQLALDGWEPKDNPMDEHYRRSPECPFFVLINQYKAAAPAKKKGRGKGTRSSKAQRLSTQSVAASVATVASDATSLEHLADPDDSILTTTSVMTQGGTKRPRAKKTAASKRKKPRAKKEEVVEVLEDPSEDIPEERREPAPKPARGRKRASADLAEDHDTSIVSNGEMTRTSLSSTAPPRKRGRPSKKSLLAQAVAQQEPPAQPSPEPEPEPEQELEPEPETEIEDADTAEPKPAPAIPQKIAKATKTMLSRDKSLPPPPESEEPEEPEPPTTPKAMISPAPAARQAAVSPSQSPQSSDAENQPPSSKPSNTEKSTRVALVPVATTPIRSSPSKRNIIAGLETTQAWTSVDVEMIFDDLDQENSLTTGRFLKGGMDLTSPEKQMTVEEWIYHNAEQAEKQLKHECEAIVMSFEREGTRAMQALEGIVVE